MVSEEQSGALIREMLAIEATGRSGTLEVHAEGAVTFVYFKQGRAIFAEEGTLGATLGRTVLAAGLITQEQYAKVVERMTDGLIECEQMRLGEVLVELRFMSPEAVHQTMSEDVRRNIVLAAASVEPSWTFQQGPVPNGVGRFPAPIGPCVIEALRLHVGAKRIEALLAPARERFGLLRSAVDEIGTRFRLSPAEFKIVGLLDGRRAIGSFSAGPDVDPAPLIAALLLAGELVLADARAASVFPPPQATPVSSRTSGAFRATTPLPGFDAASPASSRGPASQPRVLPLGAPPSTRGPASQPYVPSPSSAGMRAQLTSSRPPTPFPLRGTGPRLSAQMRAPTPPPGQAGPRRQTPGHDGGFAGQAGSRPQTPGPRPVTGPRQTSSGQLRAPPAPQTLPPAPSSRPGLLTGPARGTGRRPSVTGPRIDSPIPESPEQARAWADEAFARGKQLLRDGQMERALPELRRAARVRTDGEALVYAAWAELRECPLDEAKARKVELKRVTIAAVREERGFAFGYYVIGQLALMDGDEASAEQAFRVAHKLDPGHLDAERNLRIVTRRRTGPRT